MLCCEGELIYTSLWLCPLFLLIQPAVWACWVKCDTPASLHHPLRSTGTRRTPKRGEGGIFSSRVWKTTQPGILWKHRTPLISVIPDEAAPLLITMNVQLTAEETRSCINTDYYFSFTASAQTGFTKLAGNICLHDKFLLLKQKYESEWELCAQRLKAAPLIWA